MTTRTRVPALGAEGWFTTDDQPTLLGRRCTSCGTYAFPKVDFGCPNPSCTGTEFDEVPLSRRGTVWSYTDAQYRPPAPYVVPGEEHEPFCIAAVHLEAEGLTIMGQVVAGVGIDDLRVGAEMELVVDVLFTEDDVDHLVWKWSPVTNASGSNEEVA
ncbi:MAG: OB-fold domain-containing protein [Acidimicrobiales bacterium]|nr:OB-fold domain-containing protein [Acidimicrobiales bacterium]